MVKVQTVALLSLSLVLTSCLSIKQERIKPPQIDFTLQRVAFQIGDTKIHAQVRQFGTNRLTLVNLHDDAQASVDAAVVVLEKQGGRLIELTHSGNRRVAFTLTGKEYSFDPNRIFSSAGVRKTVRGTGSIPDKAHAAVEQFAGEFIRHFKLDCLSAFIALHNNGNGGLSIHSYEPGGDLAADTDEVFVSPEVDPDDFYFVTDKRFFTELRARKANVILQDNRIKRDDGSLSVFAGRLGIRYINVEAEPEHFDAQIRMIETAMELIR